MFVFTVIMKYYVTILLSWELWVIAVIVGALSALL